MEFRLKLKLHLFDLLWIFRDVAANFRRPVIFAMSLAIGETFTCRPWQSARLQRFCSTLHSFEVWCCQAPEVWQLKVTFIIGRPALMGWLAACYCLWQIIFSL